MWCLMGTISHVNQKYFNIEVWVSKLNKVYTCIFLGVKESCEEDFLQIKSY